MISASAPDLASADTARKGASPVDGSPMFWAGLIFGSMNIVQFAIRAGYAHIPGPALGLMWMGALGAFIMAAFVLKLGSDAAFRARPEVKRFRAVWGGLILGGAAMIAVVMSTLGYMRLYDLMPLVPAPLALVIYAIGWRIAAVMSRRAGFNLLSLAAVVAAIALTMLGAFAGAVWLALGYALVLFALAAAPGLVLILTQRY